MSGLFPAVSSVAYSKHPVAFTKKKKKKRAVIESKMDKKKWEVTAGLRVRKCDGQQIGRSPRKTKLVGR